MLVICEGNIQIIIDVLLTCNKTGGVIRIIVDFCINSYYDKGASTGIHEFELACVDNENGTGTVSECTHTTQATINITGITSVTLDSLDISVNWKSSDGYGYNKSIKAQMNINESGFADMETGTIYEVNKTDNIALRVSASIYTGYKHQMVGTAHFSVE